MFKKILVANRGEIAVRAFRAAYEIGAKTVAVYPYEDRNSVHRLKADEAYEIKAEGSPVRAYLSVEEMIRVAKLSGADAIYPGYGFLSENPELAEQAKANGIAFVGPAPEVLELAGDKVNAKAAAIRAGVPVLASSAASEDVNGLLSEAKKIGSHCLSRQWPVVAVAECARLTLSLSWPRRWSRQCARPTALLAMPGCF